MTTTTTKKKRVAIIGAGLSGMTTAKCALDGGVEVVVYERSRYVGGLWNYQEASMNKDGSATVMHSTVINTSKEVTAFSDFPPDAHEPNY